MKLLNLEKNNNMKTKHEAYTALVPMGGDFKGTIALHSVNAKNIETAISWAKRRNL